MSGALEKLQRELEAAQRALAEAEVRYASQEAEHQATTRKLEDARRKIETAHQEWIAALDIIEDPIFLHDKDFRILRCNRAYQQCVGIPFGQIIGQPYYEIFPKTPAPLHQCLNVMAGSTEAEDAEVEVVVGDTIYRSRLFAVHDEQGNYLYSIHTLDNITERKLAEDTLRESKDLLHSIVENAPVRIFWKDREGRYLGCNTRFAQDAGHSHPDELIDKTDFEMAWKDQAELYRADDKAVMDSGNAKLDYEEPQTKNDGTTVWVSTSKVPLRDDKNRIVGMLGIYQDVTERKRAEDKLRESEAFTKAVLDNLPMGIAVNSIDPAVTFSYMNDNFPRLYRTTRDNLNNPDAFWEAVYEDPEFRQQIRKRVMDDCTSGDVERMHWEDIPITRKGEETFYISARDIPLPDKSLVISMVWDVTERKRAEQVLLEEKAFSDTLIKSLPDIFYVLDRQGNFLRWSDNTADLLGLTPEEMPKTSALAFVHEADRKHVAQKLQEAFKTGSALAEARVIALRGVRYYTFTAARIETRLGTNILGIGVDITERKLAEDRLQESQERLNAIVEGALDGIALADVETRRLSSVNPAMCRMLGYSAEELEQLRIEDIHPQQDLPYVLEQFAKQASGKIQIAPDMPVKRKDGSVFYTDINSASVNFNSQNYILGIFRDITERKRSEAQLRESESAYRTLAQNLPGLVYRVFIREDGRMEFFNDMTTQITGYTADELTDGTICSIEPLILDEDRPGVVSEVTRAVAESRSFTLEYRLKHKDGNIRWMAEHGMPVYGTDGAPLYLDGVIFDTSERKQHEILMRRTNRALSLLTQCNTLLVHAKSEQEILLDICKLAVETGGYLMAWVGFAEHDGKRTVRPVAQSGYEEGYLNNVNISWADTKWGRGPTGTAIRTTQTVINQDVLANPDLAPWREAALKRGYRSSIALPLIHDKQVLGALTIYAVEPDAFSEEEVTLLEELANDLAYGVVTLRTRKEHEQHAIILRESLEQSIQTIADTVEARDPYTAGHQRRVAELATAIAREMGLPADQVNGIHLAAIIHDLGKIHIPAEILAKPGKLSPIEFELIKTHPQEGYNILKGVKFPWPIADIILQHHERQDGSGYPQGLKGEQILLEARIMAVADVVEAISSHRPYRPGLGIDSALEEIERNRDVRYDPKVADACLRLFRERDYQLPA